MSKCLLPEQGGQHMSPATLRRYHATLSGALNAAVKEQRLASNPCRHVELPSAPRPRVTPWSPTQLGAFLDHASADRLAALYELMALTGCRRGEALGLRWSDVDLDRTVLLVRRQLLDGGAGQPTFGPPKTASGEHRVIDLDTGTVGALLAHRLRQDAERAEWGEAYADHGLVFAREDGAPLRPEYATRHFQRLAAEVGLPRLRLHDLRHGAASLQLGAGVPMEIPLAGSHPALTSALTGPCD